MRRHDEELQEIEQERTRIKMKEKSFDPNKFPTNELKEQLRKRIQEDPMSVINEWEKGKLKKYFKVYDKEKKGNIPKERLQQLFEDLRQDIANIGKVPAVSWEQFVEVMGEESVAWDSFCFNLNHVRFKRAPEEILKKRIEEKYRELNRKLNANKR